MSYWENYPRGLKALLFSLNKLQNDKNGFYYPHHPERKNVSPAQITILKNGVDHYSSSLQEFEYFKDTVTADYFSPITSPDTFQKPIYFELKAFLEKELSELDGTDPSTSSG